MIKSLHTAATGMEAQQLRIDVIANNLANVNTTGFKRSRAEFEDLLYQTIREAGARDSTGQVEQRGLEVGQGTRPVGTTKIMNVGELVQTSNQFDLAIEGDGFFRITRPDGQLNYTRNGSFRVSPQGLLVNADGWSLEPNIKIPEDAISITVTTDGQVTATLPDNEGQIEVGNIELARFTNPSGLKSIGRGLLQVTPASGEELISTPGERGVGLISQGYLESSNVNVVEEMIDMIGAQRAYEINSRVIKASDEMLRDTVKGM